MLNFAKLSPRSFDWLLFVSVFLLSVLGLAAIYSVDLSRAAGLIFFKKQLLTLGIGATTLLCLGMIQYNFFRVHAKLFYFLSLLLLAGVLLFGSTIRGMRGWFDFGLFSFQPVEAAKVALILILAYAVANFGRRFELTLFFFGTGLLALLPMMLVMLQPDFGSAVILGLVWLGIILLVGTRRIFLFSFLAVMFTAAVLFWFYVLQPYQKDRILIFINPARDPLGAGYNTSQALIAIGSGQVFGKGLGFGSQSQLRFLPEAQTDFIFSVIGEELGFAGVVALLILYGVMLWRLWRIAAQSDDDFISVSVCGMMIVFTGQLLINAGANLGLLPVTGVTLPFVSYGGSSLLMNLVLIGVAQSMVVRRY